MTWICGPLQSDHLPAWMQGIGTIAAAIFAFFALRSANASAKAGRDAAVATAAQLQIERGREARHEAAERRQAASLVIVKSSHEEEFLPDGQHLTAVARIDNAGQRPIHDVVLALLTSAPYRAHHAGTFAVIDPGGSLDARSALTLRPDTGWGGPFLAAASWRDEDGYEWTRRPNGFLVEGREWQAPADSNGLADSP
jgi:hypothetical protein